jgi:hypothetical protein
MLPKFILLEKRVNSADVCEACGRPIKHCYVVKDTESNITHNIGSGCAKKLTGETIKQLYANKKLTESIVKQIDIENNSKERVQTFREINPEMMAFIENSNNSFIMDMKANIERYGTLSPKQYAVVYSMMLKPAELPCRVKDLECTLIRVKQDYNHFTGGNSVTLFCETAEKELVRVFFSSITEGLNDFMLKSGVTRYDGEMNPDIMAMGLKLRVSGSNDSYKLKRAKVTLA